MASKRIRFEVFKRDGFKCQYCGRTPPEVVLEVDRITPKAACSQFSNMGTEQWVSSRAIKYFCGICWNWIKNPDSRDW